MELNHYEMDSYCKSEGLNTEYFVISTSRSKRAGNKKNTLKQVNVKKATRFLATVLVLAFLVIRRMCLARRA